ncbi:MAG: M20/M25/M40 family metallo-hydrolase, partial [Phaeodactylibacter sp.]|nr:M20/M25/M40 family metallo-hydrolase [Phaeodactylibacter sp.]
MKKILLYSGVALSLLVAVIFSRGLLIPSMQKNFPAITSISISGKVPQHLSQAIQIPTVSSEVVSNFDTLAFQNFASFLEETYPLVNAHLAHRTFGQFSHLYQWDGTDQSLRPILLIAHFDVVPVEQETEDLWRNSPFSGLVVEDTIWGRGAIDDKMACVAILEAIEQLLSEGFQPRRTLYLALGHDEEKGGYRGARLVADYFTDQNIEFDFILDEGGAITQGVIPRIEKEVALVGIAEKGILNLELSVNIPGGHASMPTEDTAIEVLSVALARLKERPFPSRISPPTQLMFEHLGPESPLDMKMALANMDLLKSIMLGALRRTPQGNASVRTTMVPTIISGGVKENVIPQVAKAVVNLRTLPGETVTSAITHIRKAIQDDRINIKQTGVFSEPSKVADINSNAYYIINRSIREIFPEAIVIPNLLIGGTDSRHFAGLTKNIFR